MRSVTFLLSSVDGSIVGASSSTSGGRAGFAATSLAMAYSNDVPVCRMVWPSTPVMNFRRAWAAAGVLARLQDAATRDADERPRVLLLEVVQRDVLAVLLGLGLIAEPVVVIDHATGDLTGIDRLHDGRVALVGGEVRLHAGQPRLGGRLALQRQQRTDDRLEVGAAGGCRPATLPLGVLEIEQGGRQLIGRQQGGVVGEDRGSRGDPGPGAGRRTVLGGHLVEGGLVDRGEQPGILDEGHRRRVLGQEDVGG